MAKLKNKNQQEEPALKTHTLAILKQAFKELSRSRTDGVRGVWAIKSQKPGPVIGITIMTHGNEPSGLAVYHYFRHVYHLEERLRCGSVYFILNNPDAGSRYFSARSTKEKRKARFIDINMNRLPENMFARGKHGSELRRARQLQKIWSKLQYGLDIHSTSQVTKPMIIALKRSDPKLFSRFPIETVISDIDAVQVGKPASFFYGHRKAVVYAIEAGTHEAKNSFRRAVSCSRTFLAILGVIPVNRLPKTVPHSIYKVFGSIMFPDASYELVRLFKNFEPLKKGVLVARGNGGDIRVPTDCYALMPPPTTKMKDVAEEVLFLAKI